MIAVGDVAFVGVPGELFVALGKQIRAASPFRYAVIVELANDPVGNIPTKTAFGQGSMRRTPRGWRPGTER